MPIVLSSIRIRNFRLLHDVTFSIHDLTTVIVGRNNSGKSSVRELLKRCFSGDRNPTFPVEDFSFASHQEFCEALTEYNNADTKLTAKDRVPAIELRVTFSYAKDDTAFGPFSDIVIDLETDCTTATVVIRYGLKDASQDDFFNHLASATASGDTIGNVMNGVRNALATCFETTIHAEDPTNPSNTRTIDRTKLTKIIDARFIDANRALNEETNKEKGELAKVLMALFDSAQSDSADLSQRQPADALVQVMEGIQAQIHQDVEKHLEALLPSLELFGYPNLSTEPKIRTETSLDAKVLLEKDHTKVRYEGVNGILLPEAYNGLGTRNLILILLRLHEYFRAYQTAPTPPSVQFISIEEPEAHLHPQMQEVFIKQLEKLRDKFSLMLDKTGKRKWPAQFLVSTHASHIANAASFSQIRYFLTNADRCTLAKDLSEIVGDTPDKDHFLHQYLTLTRCDLFFADKVILIEGTAERFLLPEMMSRFDAVNTDGGRPLTSQYISMIEVGGAHAHLFLRLLNFLGLPALIITDIDTVKAEKNQKGHTVRVKCLVSQGEGTSNSTLIKWFDNEKITKEELLLKSDDEKATGLIRIAYQVPETPGALCGRSLEEAFILANPKVFEIELPSTPAKEEEVSAYAARQKKSDFALGFSIGLDRSNAWETPRYIAEGLAWLKCAGDAPDA